MPEQRNHYVLKSAAAVVTVLVAAAIGGWLQKVGSVGVLAQSVSNVETGIARLEQDHRRFEDQFNEKLVEAKVRVGLLEGWQSSHLREHESITIELAKALETLADIKARAHGATP